MTWPRSPLQALVQIPLWTIVTLVDLVFCNLQLVQIPLWTIVTANGEDEAAERYLFRFLYGRL